VSSRKLSAKLAGLKLLNLRQTVAREEFPQPFRGMCRPVTPEVASSNLVGPAIASMTKMPGNRENCSGNIAMSRASIATAVLKSAH